MSARRVTKRLVRIFVKETYGTRDSHDTEHSLLAVVGNTTVIEGRVGVIDDLVENEGLILHARFEGLISGGIAKVELRRLGDGVRASSPNEANGITDGSIDGEWNITENTLSGSDDDGVGGARARVTVIRA